jgi:hypothetical protein
MEDAEEEEEPAAGRKRQRATTAPTGSPHPRRAGYEERGSWREGERAG